MICCRENTRSIKASNKFRRSGHLLLLGTINKALSEPEFHEICRDDLLFYAKIR